MRIDAVHLCNAEHTHAERGSRLDVFDPRARVLCALSLAIALASSQSLAGLLAGSVIPFILLFLLHDGGREDLSKFAGGLAHINIMTIFMWVLMPLTFPGPRIWIFSVSGMRAALLFTCKLNLISVVLIRMVATLDVRRINYVLESLHVPEKMRALLLLTARYIFLLMERVATMTRAIRLRSPNLQPLRLCSAFACMLGTTLIHSSDRAERSMLAMKLRAGDKPLSGFTRRRPMPWHGRDTTLCVFFTANILMIAIISVFI